METQVATDLDQREYDAIASDPALAFLMEDPELLEALEYYRESFYKQLREGALAEALYGLGVLDRPFYQFLKVRLHTRDFHLKSSRTYWLHLLGTAARLSSHFRMDALLGYHKWLHQIFEGKSTAVCEHPVLFEIANDSWFKASANRPWRKQFAQFLVSASTLQRMPSETAALAGHFLLDISARVGWNSYASDAFSQDVLLKLAKEAMEFAAYAIPVLCRRFGPYDGTYITQHQGFRLFSQWVYSRRRQFALTLIRNGFMEQKEYRPLPTAPMFHWLPAMALSNFEKVPHETLLHLCQGHSLRTAPGLRFPLNAKAAHCFSVEPARSNWDNAFLSARVEALGGTPDLARALNRHAHRLWEWRHEALQAQAFEFLVRHEEQIDMNQVAPLLDYLQHCRAQRPDFSLKGRSLQALLRQMEDWHQELALARQLSFMPERWEPAPVKGLLYIDKSKHRYHIVQLHTAMDLIDEGREMRHCVSSYAISAAQGYCSIWSLRRERAQTDQFERIVTIELDAYRRIVQIRGVCNRAPGNEELKIIEAWRKEARLQS